MSPPRAGYGAPVVVFLVRELATRMGAHRAVHPGDAAAAVRDATEGLGVDVALEMSGVHAAIHQAFDLVRVGGRVQMLGIPAKPMDVNFATEVIFKGITIYGVVGRRMYDTWIQMTRFLRSGMFDPTLLRAPAGRALAITFENREGILPQQQSGYYDEYTVPTPGLDDRGARRIVCGEAMDCYYTGDHYASFAQIEEGQ